MFVNKIGQQHIEYGMNCQDYGFNTRGVKLVCDGCSEGKHSEVGAKLFCHMVQNGEYMQNAFEKILNLIGDVPSTIRDFMCFTILMVIEEQDEFTLIYCGDGFVIEERADGNIIIEELTDGEYPRYFAYNYTDKEYLSHYKDGVDFKTRSFPKSEYKNIGVASDGIRFIKTSDEIYGGFVAALHSGKESRVKRFINKNQSVFKDDITVAL